MNPSGLSSPPRCARSGSLVRFASLVLLVSLVAACGRRGDPLAPLHLVPDAPAGASVRRLAGDVHLRFVLPAKNLRAEGRVDLARVEIYAVTAAPGAVIPPNRELLTKKYLVGTIEVKPPTSGNVVAGAATTEDTRPSPGETVTFTETLTPEKLTPAPLPLEPLPAPAMPPATPGVPMPAPGVPVPLSEIVSPSSAVPAAIPAPVSQVAAAAPTAAGTPAAVAATAPAVPTVPVRVYILRGISTRGRPGAPSARLRVPIVPPPSRPSGLSAKHTEQAVVVEWTPPATDAGATALVYNVYAPDQTVPLNPQPLAAPSFERTGVEFGAEQCFVVRAVQLEGGVAIEGEPSERFCMTAHDTFPPAAPREVAAVANAGVVSLIWLANTEADLAGYLVLRGEAPGDRLQALTEAPLSETSYDDKTAKPGATYVYVVVAVDRATPRNMSAQSAKVTVTAR